MCDMQEGALHEQKAAAHDCAVLNLLNIKQEPSMEQRMVSSTIDAVRQCNLRHMYSECICS